LPKHRCLLCGCHTHMYKQHVQTFCNCPSSLLSALLRGARPKLQPRAIRTLTDAVMQSTPSCVHTCLPAQPQSLTICVFFCAAARYDASGKTGHASTPEQLAAVVHDIGSDKAKYEAMLAWKHRKVKPAAVLVCSIIHTVLKALSGQGQQQFHCYPANMSR
jgi:hypothetical protein